MNVLLIADSFKVADSFTNEHLFLGDAHQFCYGFRWNLFCQI